MQEEPQPRSHEVVIVGAGAAGLWAAEVCARLGREVLVLEKTPRAGTKVLASGGSRCNLTTTLGPEEAAALFGPRAARFLRAAFRALPPEEVRARFEGWGVPTVEAPLEKVFPRSQRAVDVRDALERAARAAGAALRFAAAVAEVLPPTAPGGPWTCALAEGERVLARRLLLCPGGRSVPASGTTGDGYAWLARLGLPLVEPLPALAPLASPAEWVRALTGIALEDAELRLVDADGRRLARRRRPLLFTHAGLSGPAAMDVSGAAERELARARAAGRAPRVVAQVDLLPALEREALRARLIEAAGRPGAPRLHRALPELPRRLVAAAAERAGLAEADPPAAGLSRPQRHALVETLKGLPVPVDGTLGWAKAEVTAGGLALGALDPRSMAVNGRPGLYVFGELLDLDGPIGGLNFQAAFATAELAALHAADSLDPQGTPEPPRASSRESAVGTDPGLD